MKCLTLQKCPPRSMDVTLTSLTPPLLRMTSLRPLKSGTDPLKSGADPLKSGTDPLKSGADPLKSGTFNFFLLLAEKIFLLTLRRPVRILKSTFARYSYNVDDLYRIFNMILEDSNRDTVILFPLGLRVT